MKTPEEILAAYKVRKEFYQPLHAKMRVIQGIYNGTAEIPLPDIERIEMPSVPNLLAAGVDQMAGRITSVTPSITFASMKPGVRMYDRRARDASRTIGGWWQEDRVSLKMKQRGRHLIAYAMSPTVIRWDPDEHQPTWQTRHPLETFPSTDMLPGEVQPDDCIFAYRRSAKWMRLNGYNNHLIQLTKRTDTPDDTSILLVEYIDKDQTTLMAASYQKQDPYAPPLDLSYSGDAFKGVILEQYENGLDEAPVTVPMRVTLDGATGQFDNMIGMYYMQARLMALESIAVEKGIFPDTYLVSRQGEVGRFLDGPHDGRTGKVNVISGGDIKEVQSTPGYLSNQTIDRLERAQRVTAGIPAEFGGESASNIRTGRRGDAVLSAVIDYPVAEAQELFSYSLQEENEIAIALSKKYDGDTTRTIYVGTGNNARPVTYTPNETFETDEHVVSYPATGSDLNQLIIGIGQRVGLGIMSKETASTLDPYIDNPELEHDQIITEGLEQALVSGLQQQAASGQIPPMTLAKIMTLVKNDKMELAEALNQVAEDAAKEAQKQQEAQQAQMQGMPGQAPPEMSAAGLNAAPTAAAITGQAPIAPPEQSMPGMSNLSQVLSTLRRPTQTVQPMRGIQRGAM